jgi:hypothetical protein
MLLDLNQLVRFPHTFELRRYTVQSSLINTLTNYRNQTKTTCAQGMKTITRDQLQWDCVSSTKREIRRMFTHPCRWSASAEIQKSGVPCHLLILTVKKQAQVTLQLTDCQSVLVPSLSDISVSFWKRASYCLGAPSVTRQWLFPQWQVSKKEPRLIHFCLWTCVKDRLRPFIPDRLRPFIQTERDISA